MSVWTRKDFSHMTVTHEESIIVLRIPNPSSSGSWNLHMELTEEAAEYLRERLSYALASKRTSGAIDE